MAGALEQERRQEMSFEQFSRRMRVVGSQLPENVNRVVRKVALAVDQTVVMATPVDTGRARSNWVVSLGSPTEREIEPYQPLPKGTDPSKFGESGNARGALEQGKVVIAARRPEQTICITNNVEYIEKLNDGHSAQAPAMFVEQAIDAGIAAVRETRLELGK